MWTRLYNVEGPWPGKLAVASRPRGSDWLKDEIAAWRDAGINTVLSLLTREEEEELDLVKEAPEVRNGGMKFLSLPITDRQTPQIESDVTRILEELDSDLSQRRNVLVHCRQGIGRSGLIAACLLVTKGWSAGAATDLVSAARGVKVPETAEQRRWIDRYAATLAGAK